MHEALFQPQTDVQAGHLKYCLSIRYAISQIMYRYQGGLLWHKLCVERQN